MLILETDYIGWTEMDYNAANFVIFYKNRNFDNFMLKNT